MEGITLEDRRALECLCPGGFSGPVRCTGGGATSPLWNRIRADVFAHPVQTLSTSEGGTQGAAILAGVGAGWYSDAIAGAEGIVRAAGTWRPGLRAVLVYDDVFATFCAVHDALGPGLATLALKQASTPVSDCLPETDREGQGQRGNPGQPMTGAMAMPFALQKVAYLESLVSAVSVKTVWPPRPMYSIGPCMAKRVTISSRPVLTSVWTSPAGSKT